MSAVTLWDGRLEMINSLKHLGSLPTAVGGLERRSHHEFEKPGQLSRTRVASSTTMTSGFFQRKGGRIRDVLYGWQTWSRSDQTVYILKPPLALRAFPHSSRGNYIANHMQFRPKITYFVPYLPSTFFGFSNNRRPQTHRQLQILLTELTYQDWTTSLSTEAYPPYQLSMYLCSLDCSANQMLQDLWFGHKKNQNWTFSHLPGQEQMIKEVWIFQSPQLPTKSDRLSRADEIPSLQQDEWWCSSICCTGNTKPVAANFDYF